MPAQRRGERLRRTEKGENPRSHLAECIEDSGHDDEEGEDRLYGLQGAAEDEAPDGPQDKAQGHGLFAADAVIDTARAILMSFDV